MNRNRKHTQTRSEQTQTRKLEPRIPTPSRTTAPQPSSLFVSDLSHLVALSLSLLDLSLSLSLRSRCLSLSLILPPSPP
ncbi:hypothetical protein Hdeb2414_s0006g00216411 [Helianthus debilis subsp. tardiflorus]